MMEAIQEYIYATAAMMVLRTFFADAQPAKHDPDTSNCNDSSSSGSTEATQLPSMRDAAEAEVDEEDDCAK